MIFPSWQIISLTPLMCLAFNLNASLMVLQITLPLTINANNSSSPYTVRS